MVWQALGLSCGLDHHYCNLLTFLPRCMCEDAIVPALTCRRQCRAATGGRGADCVLEVVGAPAALRLAYDLVRPGGVISAVGCHTGEYCSQPSQCLVVGRQPHVCCAAAACNATECCAIGTTITCQRQQGFMPAGRAVAWAHLRAWLRRLCRPGISLHARRPLQQEPHAQVRQVPRAVSLHSCLPCGVLCAVHFHHSEASLLRVVEGSGAAGDSGDWGQPVVLTCLK